MEKEILKKIDTAIRPQIKQQLAEIAELENRVAQINRQHAAYGAELEAAQKEIPALEAELKTALSKALPPAEVAAITDKLRARKARAADLTTWLELLDESEKKRLLAEVEEIKRNMLGIIGPMIRPVFDAENAVLNDRLRAALDLLTMYEKACSAFAESIGCTGRNFAGRYLRPDPALLRKLEHQAGWSPQDFN